MPGFVLVVTEGLLDVTAGQRLLDVLGVDRTYTRFIPKGGWEAFWRDAIRYNDAARHSGPVLGLVDLEQEPCPSGLIAQHIPHGRHAAFLLRIAERMLERWLLADRVSIARFLRVRIGHIPKNPENENNPKLALVNAARHSTRQEIREDIVPEEGSGGIVGRGYTSRMGEFIRQRWQPINAQAGSQSLRRAIAAIQAAV
jgi:hypothetical protein